MFKKLLSRMDSTTKTFVTRMLPALIVITGLAVFGIAAQTWNNPSTGSPIATLDNSGNFSLVGSGAFNFSPTAGYTSTGGTVTGGTLNGGILTGGTLTNGSLSFYMPFQGTQYKQLVISALSVSGAGRVVWAVLVIRLPSADDECSDASG
jgi:hypothetical protein